MVEPSVSSQFDKALEPFTYELWGVIIGTIAFAALLSLWLTDPFEPSNSEKGLTIQQKQHLNQSTPMQRNKAAYARLFVDHFLQKFTYFTSAGVQLERGDSLPNKILVRTNLY